MSRTPLKPMPETTPAAMPADVLDRVRRLTAGETATRSARPSPLTLTHPIPQPDPEGENRFVDRIVNRLAQPADAAPERAGRTSALSPVAPAEAPEPVLCTLLLTQDFLVRPPEPARLPHPLNPMARDGYAEDSDLDRFPAHDAVSDTTPEMSEVLRAVVRKNLRAALHEAQDTPETPAPLLNADGQLDAEALKQLVRDVVREELRGLLGAELSGQIRDAVRTELSRSLPRAAGD